MTAIAAAPGRYFERLGTREFRATPLVQGAWNPQEQHIAPVLGLIAHVIEEDLRTRRGGDLKLGRVSYDILGVIPIGVMTTEVTVVRPGRTIELLEAVLRYDGRPVVVARAWLLQAFDTATVAGTSFAPLPPPGVMPAWDMTSIWSGACIASLEVRREELAPGRARAWIRTEVDLVGGDEASATARALGLVDVANGIAARIAPEEIAFPNVDLTVHLFRDVEPGWVGLDTRVSAGPGGIGLTHSILQDDRGILGTVAQCLTIRPRS